MIMVRTSAAIGLVKGCRNIPGIAGWGFDEGRANSHDR